MHVVPTTAAALPSARQCGIVRTGGLRNNTIDLVGIVTTFVQLDEESSPEMLKLQSRYGEEPDPEMEAMGK